MNMNRLLTHALKADSWGMVPIFSTGEPYYPRILISTFNGFATPFTWDGTPFDLVTYRVNNERAGATMRLEVWQGSDKAILAYGEVLATGKNTEVSVLLPTRITTHLTSDTVLYVAMRVLDPGVRMHGHYVENYHNVADPNTYPQHYCTTTDWPAGRWVAAGGGIGQETVFKLFDTTSVTLPVEEPYCPRHDEPVLAPNLYGIVGREVNVYLDNLIWGQAPGVWGVDGANQGTTRQGMLQGGREQPWRFTIPSPTAMTNGTLSISRRDPTNLQPRFTKTARVDIVAGNAAGGATRKLLCMGDSNTASGVYTQRLLDLAAANSGAVQYTLLGTLGTAPNRHEGVSGYTSGSFYQPATGSPFRGSNGYFSASAWLTAAGQGNPDIVLWAVGVNDAYFGGKFDGSRDAYLVAKTYIERIDAMIGLTTDANVVSWKTAVSSAKHIVAVPIPPCLTQDAFGQFYGTEIDLATYKRFLAVIQNRVVEHYRTREADGVFVLGCNACVDPYYGYALNAAVPANAYSSVNIVHQGNSVHPTVGLVQMGDALDAQINVLVSQSKI